MATAAAVAAGLTNSHTAALFAQNVPQQVEDPTVAKQEDVIGKPSSNAPGDLWPGKDSPELVAAAMQT